MAAFLYLYINNLCMRPSKIKVTKAKKALFLFPGFRALTWKGIVYCKDKFDVNLINSVDAITSDFESHETLHIRQAESTKDSWFVYYTLYLWQWFCNFPLFFVGWRMPYNFIPFELEAFTNETNHDYPMHGPVYQWKEFKKLTMKQKFAFAKGYKKQKGVLTFKQYIRNVVAPTIIK